MLLLLYSESQQRARLPTSVLKLNLNLIMCCMQGKIPLPITVEDLDKGINDLPAKFFHKLFQPVSALFDGDAGVDAGNMPECPG